MKNLIKIIGFAFAILALNPSCSRPLFDSYFPTSVAPCVPRSYLSIPDEKETQKPATANQDSLQTLKEQFNDEILRKIRNYKDPDELIIRIPFMKF